MRGAPFLLICLTLASSLAGFATSKDATAVIDDKVPTIGDRELPSTAGAAPVAANASFSTTGVAKSTPKYAEKQEMAESPRALIQRPTSKPGNSFSKWNQYLSSRSSGAFISLSVLSMLLIFFVIVVVRHRKRERKAISYAKSVNDLALPATSQSSHIQAEVSNGSIGYASVENGSSSASKDVLPNEMEGVAGPSHAYKNPADQYQDVEMQMLDDDDIPYADSSS
ncbi:uncharacterized protein [Watersipora subatra]|uniref:uncharacterized protein n=1 Tax=Watersipora subatra TaxID=2589382 RepID=UPI00355B8E63